jgi:chemotaxis signal transduction protein
MESEITSLDAEINNLDAAVDGADHQVLRYGFSIGNLNFIYDMQIPCELVKGASIYAVPNTPNWMLGLINLRGSLVPAFNLARYFDFKEDANTQKLLLVLGKGEKAVAFQLKTYPELLSDLTKLDEIPKLMPKVERYVLAAYSAEKTWLELDKESFFSMLGEKVCI